MSLNLHDVLLGYVLLLLLAVCLTIGVSWARYSWARRRRRRTERD